jgi:tyrosine-specific transport protein
MNKTSRIIGGILLVTGTTIGAGMLALPVSTGLAGFIPSAVMFVLYWIYMSFTALLFLEVNLWMGANANILTMAKQTLGRAGEIISWIFYLFLLYALTTAYLAGGGSVFTDFILSITGYQIEEWMSLIPLLIIFGYFVFHGTQSVDYLNRILMLCLTITFIILIALSIPHIDLNLTRHVEWKYLTIASSIAATAYGFHVVIPSLTTYLKRDTNQLRLVILIGSFIPLVVYLIWDFVALGIIPISGPNGIVHGFVEGSNGTHLISQIINNPIITLIARAFAFCAIITSFLGVSLSLIDFLADGLKIEKNFKGKLLLCSIAFIPPLAFTLTDPRAFLTALEFAGAFGVVILLGILPALMVWSGRYIKGFKGPYQAPGGKLALILTVILSFVVIAIEIGNRIGYFSIMKG